MGDVTRHNMITFWTKPIISMPEKVRYAVFGEEICPETKNTHWQGYVEFYKPQRASTTYKIFSGDKKIKVIPRRGTREQARDYCMKDGKYEEVGEWTQGQGQRTDLEGIVKELIEDKTLSEVMLDNPSVYCRYRNGLKDISASVIKTNTKEFRKIEVILIIGPTGCGKTRRAMEESEYRIQGHNLGWWQDYDQEKVICIDEYNNDINITETLSLLDGYQLRLNIKGSHTYANWNKVFITSNLTIDEIHSNAKPAHRDALFRRITQIINFWDENETK